jgi:CRISPR-associated protein Cas1
MAILCLELRAINTVDLDAYVGFLHEMKQSKNSLAYDPQEPFRFLVNIAVISLIESEKMGNKSFIRTESHSLRLKPSGAKKFIEQFNKCKIGYMFALNAQAREILEI